jgi:hypothetical protein
LFGATILQLNDDGEVAAVDYDQATPIRLAREFLAAPGRLLRHLLDDGQG